MNLPVRAFVDPIRGFAGAPREFERPDRATLADIIALVPLDNEALRPLLRVKLGGVLIDPGLYHRVLPKQDAFLTVVLPAHGGDNLLGTIAAVALIGASLFVGGFGLPFLGSAFAAGSFGASLVAGGLSMAASLLLQGLSTPPTGNASSSKDVGVASAQNAFEPGAYLQRVIGTRKVAPQMVMPPFSQIDGDDQLVTAVYGLAGPHQFTDIKVGTADIDGAADIEYELKEGFADDTDLTLVTDTRIEVPIGLRLSQFRMESSSSLTSTVDTSISPYTPQWHRVETKHGPDRARLFLTFDAGLIFSGSAGPEPSNCAIRLRIRRRGTVSWYNLPEFIARGEKQNGALRLVIDFHWLATGDMPGSVTAFATSFGGWTRMFQSVQKTTVPTATFWTAGAYFATNKVDYLSKQQLAIYLDTVTFPQSDAYEIEVMRGYSASDNILTINSSVMHTIAGTVTHYDFFTSVTANGDQVIPPTPPSHVDGLLVAAIQSIWNEYPFDLTNQPTMLLAIRARNRSLEQVSGIASGYVPDWNGSAWIDDQVTSNPASWYREVLSGDLNAEPVPSTLVDSANLQDWHEWNTTEGHEVNAIVQGQPVTEVLSLIAQAGFARPRFAATHGVVIDRPRDPVGLITQRNAAGFSFQKPFGRLPHALRVNLADAANDYEVRELVVYADGYNADGSGGLIEASRFESVTYQGIIDGDEATARGKRDLRFAKHRSRLLNFSMDIEHLEFQLGDLVLVETDILGQVGGRGRVASITSSGGLVTGLMLDEERDFTHADANSLQRAVAMRLADGTVRVERVTADDSNLNAVVFSTPFVMPTSGGDDLIVDGTLVATGTLGLEARRVLIWDMAPGPDLTCQITGIDYAEKEIYRLFQSRAAFAGHGSLSVVPRRKRNRAVAFAGTGQLAASYTRFIGRAVAFTGAGSLSAAPKASFVRAASLGGVGSLAVVPNRIQQRAVAMVGVGSLAAIGQRQRLATVLMEGVSSLAVHSVVTRRGAVAMAGVGALALTSRVTRKGAAAFAGVGGLAVAPVKIPGFTLSLVTSVTVDATTITMPTVQTGDFVFLADMAAKNTSGSTQETPPTISGFTPLVQFPITGDAGGASTNATYVWTYGRIVTNGAGESGGTITGSALGATAGFRRKTLLVFRGSTPLTTMGAAESASKVWSTSDPAATSTALSPGTPPFIAFAVYRGSGALVSPTLSPTEDGEVLNGTATSVRYKFYTAAAGGSFVADMGDSGTNILASFLVELS